MQINEVGEILKSCTKHDVKIFALGFALISTGIFYQNCAAKKSTPIDTLPFQIRTTAITWNYGSGALPPDYGHHVTYKIDFTSKTVVIYVTKGVQSTTPTPTSGTKPISDAQISQIRNLLGQVNTSVCSDADQPPGRLWLSRTNRIFRNFVS